MEKFLIILKNTSRDKNVKKIDNIIFENRQNISSHNTLVAPTILKKKFIRTSNKIKCEKALVEHTELRVKSKVVRNNFTNTLKEHGYKNPYEYIQTTKQKQ